MPKNRSMQGNRSEGTKPELAARELLEGACYEILAANDKDLPGSPDLVLHDDTLKVAVFVDGAFWHAHPDHYTPGKSGDFWDNKMARNIQRDREVDEALKELGWVVIRFWDVDLHDPNKVLDLVGRCIREGRSYDEVIGLRPSLDDYFFRLAKNVAKRSICPEGKRHGAVLVNEKRRIISTGYNGPPSGAKECRRCTLETDHRGKDWRTCPAMHAEVNAVLPAPRAHGEYTLYVTKRPCEQCQAMLDQERIKVEYEED